MKLWVWFALFLAAVPAGAGTAPSPEALAQVEAEAEEGEEGFAGSLSLKLDGRGGGDLTLWTPDGKASAEVRQRLQQALPCKVEPPHEGPATRVAIEAQCTGLLRRRGGVVRGRFDPAVVERALGAAKGARLNVYLTLPRTAFSRCDGWQRIPLGGSEVSCSPLSAQSRAVEIAYGYRPADVGWRLAVLTLLAVVPLARIIRRRGPVLAAPDGEQRRTAWFAYWRAFRAVHQGGWFLWIAAFYALRIQSWLEFEIPGAGARIAAEAALLIVPPSLVFLATHALSRPVLAHVRELSLSPRESAEEALGFLLAGLVPLPLLILGWSTMSDSLEIGVGCIGAAVVSALAGRRLLVRGGLLAHAISTGELRDRVFAMAGKVRVKLRDLYVLSASRRRLANAFATSANTVILTDYLLANLSRRETEAVVAHELGHLRYRHPVLLTVAVLAIVYGVIFFGSTFGALFVWPMLTGSLEPSTADRLSDVTQSISLLPLVLLAGLFPLRWFSRRAERSADAYAGMLTGDPEAMISALGKLSRLSLIPVRWGRFEGAMSTHPAMEQRGEALALRFGISFDRMQQLLRGEAGESSPAAGESFALPPAILDPQRVFTTRFKARTMALILWTSMLLNVALCLAGAEWARAGGSFWLRFAAACVGITLVRLVAAAFLALLGYPGLKRRLAERLRAEGLEAAAGGQFGGFSPDGAPRSYEGHTSWDVGFIVLGDDGLAYAGDQARFRLRREQVDSVRTGRGYPSWLTVPCVLVDWRDGEGPRETSRTMSLRAIGRSLFSGRRLTRRLARSVAEWHRATSRLGDLPPALAALPEPPTAAVTGHSPREGLAWKPTLILLWLQMILLVLGSWLFKRQDLWVPALGLALVVHFLLILPVFLYGKDS